jgi:hypothetical protein
MVKAPIEVPPVIAPYDIMIILPGKTFASVIFADPADIVPVPEVIFNGGEGEPEEN